MGHHCCNKQKVRRGLWSPEEDEKLIRYVTTYGHRCWSSVPKEAGLQRCGKSCRLRWINYLRPDLKRGSFSPQEERIIIDVHRLVGNRWAQIAKHLPGRTDNEVKNYWNSCIKKKLVSQGLDPNTHNNISLPSANSTALMREKQSCANNTWIESREMRELPQLLNQESTASSGFAILPPTPPILFSTHMRAFSLSETPLPCLSTEKEWSGNSLWASNTEAADLEGQRPLPMFLKAADFDGCNDTNSNRVNNSSNSESDLSVVNAQSFGYGYGYGYGGVSPFEQFDVDFMGSPTVTSGFSSQGILRNVRSLDQHLWGT
ncbi:hypothetical protein AMTRI_Chr02g256290 [Amborella trichopoda]